MARSTERERRLAKQPIVRRGAETQYREFHEAPLKLSIQSHSLDVGQENSGTLSRQNSFSSSLHQSPSDSGGSRSRRNSLTPGTDSSDTVDSSDSTGKQASDPNQIWLIQEIHKRDAERSTMQEKLHVLNAEITKLSADVEKAANVVNSSMTKVKSLEAQKSKYGASHEEIKADPHISKCKTFTMNNSKVLKGKQDQLFTLIKKRDVLAEKFRAMNAHKPMLFTRGGSSRNLSAQGSFRTKRP